MGVVYLDLGFVYEKFGKWKEAKDSFERAKEVDPNLSDRLFRFGDEDYDLGHYNEAIEYYERVIRLEPDNAQAHYNLAEVHLKIGDKELAEEILRASNPSFSLLRESAKFFVPGGVLEPTAIGLKRDPFEPREAGDILESLEAGGGGVTNIFNGPVINNNLLNDNDPSRLRTIANP